MQTPGATDESSQVGAGRIVLRNTMYLGVAEVLVIPLSIFLNGLMGRYLGPEDMGYLYLAMNITKFAFLGVEWGGAGALPAAVVVDRANAGTLLGSSLSWRAASSVVAYLGVAITCHLLGYSEKQQWVIGLVFLLSLVTTMLGACQDVIRGFERTDIAAYSRVGSQFLMVLLVIPVLVMGGGIRFAIVAQAVATLGVLLFVQRSLRPTGVGNVRYRLEALKKLMVGGTPFVFFGFGLALQPGIDAFYLAKYSPPDVVGWFAVAQKLVGFLILPAMSLVGALYPTLCRLYATDKPGFQRTTRDAIGAVTMLVVPVSLCCALFPEVGVSIYGRAAFRPAEDTLKVFALFLVLVYFTLPIGTAMVAAGKQRAWTLVQLVSVGSSAIFDPLLIRRFQEHGGNGGIGLAFASTIAELVMCVGGAALMPAGVFDRGLAKTLALAVLSGAAMGGAALLLRPLPALAVAPVALLVYAGALVLTGAITRDQRQDIVGFVRRKLLRNRTPAA